MQPKQLLQTRSGDNSTLGKALSGSLEKGLSGTYDVPSGAAIAEKVHQLSLRRKKPAWATTRPSQEEHDQESMYESETAHRAEAALMHAAPNSLSGSSQEVQAPVVEDGTAVIMLNATPAAPAAAAHPEGIPPSQATKPSQPAAAGNRMDSTPSSSSADMVTSFHASSDAPDSSDEGKTGKQTKLVDSLAGRLQQRQGHASHYLATNRVTLARISSVAQEQMEHKLRKEKQNSIEKHVLQHDMFQGGNQPAHTVHRPDAIPESFQEPTLAAILRETALAEDLAQREAGKAAKSADNALPLFVTTSSSPESTSRQHSRSFGPSVPSSRPNSRPVSRPASAANTLTRRQLASELSSGPDALLPHQLSQVSKLQSPRGKSAGLSHSSTPSSTGRLASSSSSLQVNMSNADSMDSEWRAAASGYAAQVLHSDRSVSVKPSVATAAASEASSSNSRQTSDSDAAADFAVELPASITLPSTVGGHSKLERFDSMARGDSSDGVRHSRQALQQSETFSPQVDAHSMKLAEAVYEQTRALGPTPLQGRLNYLHQLGKITLRDRSNSILKLPQQREDVEFAMCTFAPKLNKRPLSDDWAGSVIERSEAWQARRNQKLHEAREHDADKDLEGCTFWPDLSASSRSLVGTLEAAAMTRSLPEQEVLKYLSQGHPAVGAEGSVMTNNTSRSMNTNSLHDMPSDLATYVSQLKYYERMHKVKEREQHVQEVLSKFDGSKWVYHITKPCAPKLGQAPKETIPSLAPPVRLMPGMIAAHHALRAEA